MLSTRSPLWMVTREPLLTELIAYLDDQRKAISAAPDQAHALHFSGSHLEKVRVAFSATIRRGEEKLHRLCELLCGTLLGCSYELLSVVYGQVEGAGERFILSQSLSRDDLYSTTDIDLGNRQLGRLRFQASQANGQDDWRRATLVANFVEYHPDEPNAHGIHKVISRIKAEEEIWNKVVDEIFDLDAMVARDKQLRHLSRFVKDVFGLKIVVGGAEDARGLQADLQALRWTGTQLQQFGIDDDPSVDHLTWIEVKDYLDASADDAKRSGWEAIKSVVGWWGETFEIQVQPLHNYHRERERLTRESHAGFKAQRDALRDRTAQLVPLFGFYRDLLRWLFSERREAAPSFAGVTIEITP
jgi:hypothetical protein